MKSYKPGRNRLNPALKKELGVRWKLSFWLPLRRWRWLIRAFKRCPHLPSIREAVAALHKLSNEERGYSEGPLRATIFESCVVEEACCARFALPVSPGFEPIGKNTCMHLKEEMVSVPRDPGILLQRCRLAGPLVLSSRVCPAGSLIPRALELCAEQRPDTGSRPVLSQGSYFVPGPCLPRVSRPWDVHLST